jgi:hypothetical protein
VDGNGLGLCPMVGFGISGVETSGSTRELLRYITPVNIVFLREIKMLLR